MILYSYLERYNDAIKAKDKQAAVDVICELYDEYCKVFVDKFPHAVRIELIKGLPSYPLDSEPLMDGVETFKHLYSEYHNDEFLVDLLLENTGLSIEEGKVLEVALRKPSKFCSHCSWSIYHYEMDAEGRVDCYDCYKKFK
jgi:hypothetical protein